MRVRMKVEGDGIEGVDGNDFVINELEIRTQHVSKFLFQGFWESVDSFIDFLFIRISIRSQVTNHISRPMDHRFRLSSLNYHGVHVFCLLTLHCLELLLGLVETIGFSYAERQYLNSHS